MLTRTRYRLIIYVDELKQQHGQSHLAVAESLQFQTDATMVQGIL
jgi:hypothetical protein